MNEMFVYDICVICIYIFYPCDDMVMTIMIVFEHTLQQEMEKHKRTLYQGCIY